MSAQETVTAIVIDAILKHPKIEQGFVQRTYHLDKLPIIPVSGGSGAWHYEQRRRANWRVWLQTEGSQAECEHESLEEAARVVFEQLGVSHPL